MAETVQPMRPQVVQNLQRLVSTYNPTPDCMLAVVRGMIGPRAASDKHVASLRIFLSELYHSSPPTARGTFEFDVLFPWMLWICAGHDVYYLRHKQRDPPLNVLTNNGPDDFVSLSEFQSSLLLMRALLGCEAMPVAHRPEKISALFAAEPQKGGKHVARLKAYLPFLRYCHKMVTRAAHLVGDCRWAVNVVRRVTCPVTEGAVHVRDAPLCEVTCDPCEIESTPGPALLAINLPYMPFLHNRYIGQAPMAEGVLRAHPSAYVAWLLVDDAPCERTTVHAENLPSFAGAHRQSDETDARSTLAFIHQRECGRWEFHTRDYIQRELHRLIASFRPQGKVGLGADGGCALPSVVSTGPWAPDDGDWELDFAMQWCAASAAGLRMAYHTYGDSVKQRAAEAFAARVATLVGGAGARGGAQTLAAALQDLGVQAPRAGEGLSTFEVLVREIAGVQEEGAPRAAAAPAAQQLHPSRLPNPAPQRYPGLHPSRLPPFPKAVLGPWPGLRKVAIFFVYAVQCDDMHDLALAAREWWRTQHARLCSSLTTLHPHWTTIPADPLPVLVEPFVRQIDGDEVPLHDLFSYFADPDPQATAGNAPAAPADDGF